jgi:hypothetical protein
LIAATTSLNRRVAARLPAGADARSAADCGVGRATDPHRQVGLHGLRRDGGAFQFVEGAEISLWREESVDFSDGFPAGS